MSEDESDTVGLDGLDVEDSLLDPDNETVYFERRQDADKEFPDTYRHAQIMELSTGETLAIELTLRQLQGWADTLGAKLSEVRRRVGEDLADVDEVYVLYRTRDGVRAETRGVAFTFRAAKEAQLDMRNELDEPWCEEIEIDTVPFFTG